MVKKINKTCICMVALMFGACNDAIQYTATEATVASARVGAGAASSAQEAIVEFARSENGNAVNVEQTAEGQLKEEFVFGMGVQAPLADFLIVLDNSCSMKSIIPKVVSGFLDLAKNANLPKKAKFAVMSTMHASASDFSKPGPGIKSYPGIEFEPGFLELVDKKAIERYIARSEQNAKSWSIEGCEQKWLSLGEKNSNGQPCLAAATQSTFSCLRAEAGIRSVYQLSQKHVNGTLFRQGTILNVIFVSDTHDPGANVPELLNDPISFDQISEHLRTNNQLSGLKFHAIAPEEACSGEGLYDHSYFKLSQASGGQIADSCYTNQFAGFFEKMIEISSQPTEPVFRTSKQIINLLEVRIDGKATDDYVIKDDFTVQMPTLANSTKKHEVSIIYDFFP